MALTAEQTHALYRVLAEHETRLGALAERSVQTGKARLADIRLRVRLEIRRQEVHALDLAARSLPWVVEPQVEKSSEPRLVCDLPPNRGTVYLIHDARFWRGYIERPRRFKRESVEPLLRVEDALAWVEQELRQAADEAAAATEAPLKPPRLTLATLSPELRACRTNVLRPCYTPPSQH